MLRRRRPRWDDEEESEGMETKGRMEVAGRGKRRRAPHAGREVRRAEAARVGA